MNQDKIIIEVAKIIEQWNPLGEAANSVEQLEGYRYEEMDIISSIRIMPGTPNIKEITKNVLTQAFHIELDEVKLDDASIKIESVLNSIK